MNDSDTTRLPQRLRSFVESELQAGERLTWIGQPIPGRIARIARPLVLFGILWTAFAIFWTAFTVRMTFKKGTGPDLLSVFPLSFGLVFILIGFGMLSSPYWMRRLARLSAYVLTDRRAILLDAGPRGSVTIRSFEPERLTNLRCKEGSDGSGDLVFTQDIGLDREGDRVARDVGFLAIREVRSVEELVRALAQRSGG